ncbi:MAG: hypothetical protein LBJ73_05000 [Rickettsiales bacterium]|jgi:hypothetical protein|nr:hypothetical protein [Rickettsiales bacterium]
MSKKLYVAIVIVALAWTGYRVFSISSESARAVFNPFRDNAARGAPVEKLVVKKAEGVLKEPLFVKNNRAYVSCARIGKFRAGQAVGAGRVAGVSNFIDLDTGMCAVRTVGAADGAQLALIKHTGFFVPVYVVQNNSLMVVENGAAAPRTVTVAADDSEYALVSHGLSDGDTVILSHIEPGEKVR